MHSQARLLSQRGVNLARNFARVHGFIRYRDDACCQVGGLLCAETRLLGGADPWSAAPVVRFAATRTKVTISLPHL